MSSLDHPAIVNVLHHLSGAGRSGLRASFLVKLLDGVRPYPPPIVVLRQLVDAGYARASPAPATIESMLVITQAGEAALDAARAAGAWLCEGITPTPGDVAREINRAGSVNSGSEPGVHDAENRDADARAFKALDEVLTGTRRVGLDGESSKMLRIVLSGDTDTVITPEWFLVHFGARKRHSSQYFRRLLPAVMSELLQRASVDAVVSPVVIGLPASTVATSGGFPEWSYEARLMWVVPGPDSVRLLVRRSPAPLSAPFVQPIPEKGALAYRELPEWTPSVAVRELSSPLPCPACGTPATRYRALRDALVCLTCGRSFEHAR